MSKDLQKKQSSTYPIVDEQENIDKSEPGDETFLQVERMISGFVSNANVNPLAEKIQPEHVTQMLTNEDTQNGRNYSLKKHTQYITLIYVIIGVIVLMTALFLFKDNDKIINMILTGSFSFLGGFGVGKYKKKK